MQQDSRFWKPTGRRLLITSMSIAVLGLSACTTKGSFSTPDMARSFPADTESRQSLTEETNTTTKEALVAEGDQLQANGNRALALLKFLRAAALAPNDAMPRERIGFLHIQDDPERAEAIFRDLIEDHPESIPAHTGLSLALAGQDALEEARQVVEKALDIDHESVEALFVAGVVYDDLGIHDLAQATYRVAHRKDPTDHRILNNLGFSYLATEDYEEAVDALQGSIDLNPDNPAAHNNLGLALGRLEQYDAALEAFRAGGNEAVAQNNLAHVYYLNGHRELATKHYEQALTLEGAEVLKAGQDLEPADSL
jgi:Flp pilus assembly protein TadD